MTAPAVDRFAIAEQLASVGGRLVVTAIALGTHGETAANAAGELDNFAAGLSRLAVQLREYVRQVQA